MRSSELGVVVDLALRLRLRLREEGFEAVVRVIVGNIWFELEDMAVMAKGGRWTPSTFVAVIT